MGIPSDVLLDSVVGGGLVAPAKENARTVVVVTASGGPNLLLAGPPAGFTRRCVVEPVQEGGVSVMNPVGGSNVQFDFLLNANIYDRRTTDLLPDGTPFVVDNAPYLTPSDSLFGTYTAGASTLHWSISYTDYPLAELVSFDVPLISGDTIVVPTPPAGKSHVLDGIGENGTGVYVYNPGGNTPNIFSKVNGLQVIGSTPVAPGTSLYAVQNPGLAVDNTNVSLSLNADATGARAHGAYWVIDKGAN